MKKTILGAALLAALSMTASANDTIKSNISIGGESTTIGAESGKGWDIGYGVNKIWDNGLYSGFDMVYGQTKLDTDTVNSFGMDFKLGYQWKDIAVYGIGSGLGDSYGGTTGYGYGYGAGIEYAPHQWKHVGIGLDYKQYKMTNEFVKYDKDTAKAYLKIFF